MNSALNLRIEESRSKKKDDNAGPIGNAETENASIWWNVGWRGRASHRRHRPRRGFPAPSGSAADADAFLNGINTKAVGTTHGTLDTEATNVGTTDLEVLADFTGATGDGTAGVATVTVLYAQNNNLS